VSHIELAPEVGDNFDYTLDHLAEYQVENPVLRIREIIEALNALEHNPMIGRPPITTSENWRSGAARMAMWPCTVTSLKSTPFLSLPCASSNKRTMRSFE